MKHTRDEVRRAVAKGKTLIVRPYEDTEVHIRSTHTEHALNVVDAVQPFPDRSTPEDMENICQQVELIIMFNAEEYPHEVERMLRRFNEAYEVTKP